MRNKIKNAKDMSQIKYKTTGRIGLFDRDETSAKLSKLGNPLEKLSRGIDFEIFRFLLEDNLSKISKGPGGRPPYDYILMFKILIVNEGKIVDASFVEVPRQRNSRKENAQIKAGEIPESFTQNPHK